MADPTKEELAAVLDAEGYGAWVDTDQLVDTLRQYRDLVLAALDGQPASDGKQ